MKSESCLSFSPAQLSLAGSRKMQNMDSLNKIQIKRVGKMVTFTKISKINQVHQPTLAKFPVIQACMEIGGLQIPHYKKTKQMEDIEDSGRIKFIDTHVEIPKNKQTNKQTKKQMNKQRILKKKTNQYITVSDTCRLVNLYANQL